MTCTLRLIDCFVLFCFIIRITLCYAKHIIKEAQSSPVTTLFDINGL